MASAQGRPLTSSSVLRLVVGAVAELAGAVGDHAQ